MAYEPKDNSLTLFVNDRKDKPNQPDYRGDGIVNGVPVKLSAWKKKGQSGTVFLSIAVQNKDVPAPGRQQPAGAEPNQRWSEIIDDGEIPF